MLRAKYFVKSWYCGARISNAVVSVTPQMQEHILHETEYRLELLRDTNGIHVEKY
jgi:hypothetical protein